ncbi:MAG: type II toxin-antitoxin system HicA family toxin [Sphingomonas sp.]|nr:type II toxin-antitoxin system HicA family toxin [Sphingomonas sp.]
MTKAAKLFAWIVANPRAAMSFRDFERILLALGFTHVRTSGSHRAYHHVAINKTLIIQPRGKDAKPYQVQQFLDMVEAFDLTLED